MIVPLFYFFQNGNEVMNTTMPVDSPEKKKISLKDFESHKHISNLLNGLLQRRAANAIDMALQASSYDSNDILVEIGPSQYLLLMLLYAFTAEDLTFAYLLLELVDLIKPQLKSYLKVWLMDEFSFHPDKIYKAICFLCRKKDRLDVPPHILETILHLKDKYNVLEQCNVNEDADVLEWINDFQPKKNP